jgi:hypothetical protein
MLINSPHIHFQPLIARNSVRPQGKGAGGKLNTRAFPDPETYPRNKFNRLSYNYLAVTPFHVYESAEFLISKLGGQGNSTMVPKPITRRASFPAVNLALQTQVTEFPENIESDYEDVP